MIYFILVLVGLIGWGFYFYQIKSSKNLSKYYQPYKIERTQILKSLKFKRDQFIEQQTQEIQEQISSIQQKLNEINLEFSIKEKGFQENLLKIKEHYEEEFSNVKNNYLLRRQEIEEKILIEEDLRKEQLTKKIIEEQESYQRTLEALKNDFISQQEQITNDFKIFEIEVLNKKEFLQQEIQEYERQQLEIINRFKKDAETRQRQEFFSVSISDSDKEDIKKLRIMAEELHKPTILYKLIYENYYKVPVTAMIKRVLGENCDKCGIYKITNKETQEIYIGKTTSFKTRWITHIKRGLRCEEGTMNKFYAALWEKCIENFTFEIVEICSKENYSEREKYWISFYKSDQWGYNTKTG